MSLSNPRKVGVGGILHNSSGLWISGFSLNLGIATNNIAKLWAIRQGLLLVWYLGFKFVYLETNSTTVITWLIIDGISSQDVVPLISDCRNLMAQAWAIHLLHIYREANEFADALAKWGHQQ